MDTVLTHFIGDTSNINKLVQHYCFICYFKNCPLFEVQHQQTLPEDLDTQTKLWWMEADLRVIAQFVASTDLTIER
jgi:hypothetical protein